ncbi:uncharacterized protein LOC134245534 [Saccostrea cucullata]|uniref:uncharacterized protein LOC134245534 n=1 Tax=Saccostrea cuccullata TaxID=36930 RepID=UPI002ED1CAC4
MAKYELAGGLIVTERVSPNLRIYNVAKHHVGSLLWSTDSDFHGGKRKDKSAMFVYDVITEADLVAPCQKPWFCGYFPAHSSEWGDRKSQVIHACRSFHPVSIPMRGDIVAFPNNNGQTHCGIVSTGGCYIGTSDKRIVETKIPSFTKRVFWRYVGNVPSTNRSMR